MPAKFDRCVASGGRVRTKTLGGGRYMHLCFNKKTGKATPGHIKVRKPK